MFVTSYSQHVNVNVNVNVLKALCYKPEDRRFETRSNQLIFSVYLILPAAPGPRVHSASNMEEDWKIKISVHPFLQSKSARCVEQCCPEVLIAYRTLDTGVFCPHLGQNRGEAFEEECIVSHILY
jgi:hypothetical protein